MTSIFFAKLRKQLKVCTTIQKTQDFSSLHNLNSTLQKNFFVPQCKLCEHVWPKHATLCVDGPQQPQPVAAGALCELSHAGEILCAVPIVPEDKLFN